MGNRGVFLFDEDILLLKQLLIHQSMRATTIHEFYQALAQYSMNESRNVNGITNRLGKLTAAGVLVQSRVKLRGSYFLYHYRLGTRGVDVLVELKILDASDKERVVDSSRKFAIPSEHTEAMSHIANQIYISLYTNDTISEFTQTRGSAHKDFGHSRSQIDKIEENVVPDWVFTCGDTIVCVEVDTGSQRQHMIKHKYKSYIKHARRFIEAGKKVVVVFSVVDGTIFNRFSKNRDKRVSSIKQLAPPFNEWVSYLDEKTQIMDSEEKPLDLQFYAVSAKQTANLIERILIGSQPFSSVDRFQYAEDWMRKARYVMGKDYVLESIEKEQVYLPRRDPIMDCDLVVSVKPKGRERERLFLVIYGEEGSVITYQLIRTNGARLSKLNEVERPNYGRLLVCYDEMINMKEDVYGQQLPCEMWQTDSDSWVKAMSEGQKAAAPEIMHVISPFKKEWRRFNE